VILRCVIKKKGHRYIAYNLELSLAAEGASAIEAKKRLKEAITAYFDVVESCLKKGEKVKIRPTYFYWFKRILFDITYNFNKLIHRWKEGTHVFTEVRVMPYGVF